MSFPPRHSPPAPRQPAARLDWAAARRHTHKQEPRSRRSAAIRGVPRRFPRQRDGGPWRGPRTPRQVGEGRFVGCGAQKSNVGVCWKCPRVQAAEKGTGGGGGGGRGVARVWGWRPAPATTIPASSRGRAICWPRHHSLVLWRDSNSSDPQRFAALPASGGRRPASGTATPAASRGGVHFWPRHFLIVGMGAECLWSRCPVL